MNPIRGSGGLETRQLLQILVALTRRASLNVFIADIKVPKQTKCSRDCILANFTKKDHVVYIPLSLNM